MVGGFEILMGVEVEKLLEKPKLERIAPSAGRGFP
jgi:hypothetical protein